MPAFPALTLLPGRVAVCRLAPDAPFPPWATAEGPGFVSLTRTPDELSVVCAEALVPASLSPVERGFRAFRLEGPVPFATTGVLSGLTAPLAAAGLSVFVLSTYDTDYLMVKEPTLAQARRVLADAGFVVRP